MDNQTLNSGAIAHIEALSVKANAREIREIHGEPHQYIEGRWQRIPKVGPKLPSINTRSLDGFVSYLAERPGVIIRGNHCDLMALVEPEKGEGLTLICETDHHLHQSCDLTMTLDPFVVHLYKRFYPTPARDNLITAVSSARAYNEFIATDDNAGGTTIETKQGVALVKNVTIQNPIMLVPRLGFDEIMTPKAEVPCIFRMEKSDKGFNYRLIETSTNDAIGVLNQALRDYLKAALPEALICV